MTFNKALDAGLITVSAADAVVVSGETRAFAGRHFCPRCGSSVFSVSGDEVEVNLGALDAPDQFRPTYELWTTRREAWSRHSCR